jgi:hypothetical protein
MSRHDSDSILPRSLPLVPVFLSTKDDKGDEDGTRRDAINDEKRPRRDRDETETETETDKDKRLSGNETTI